MSLLLAFLLSAAATTQTPPPATEPTIIVNGIRLGDARHQLEACLARHCPPLEDVAATLRYAEALFLDGRYEEARAVLRSSIDRNRRFASRYPVAVAGLYRANARMAMHEGDGEDLRRSTFSVEQALRTGLPATDPRILGARLETAEMRATLADGVTLDPMAVTQVSRYSAAMRAFRDVAQTARQQGRPDLAALADLRRAILARRIGASDARQQLEALAALADPRARTQRIAARVILAQIDREAGNTATMDRLIDELAAAGVREPVLLYAPAIGIEQGRSTTVAQNWTPSGPSGGVAGVPIAIRNVDHDPLTESFDYWVDIGFSITAQGRVEDVEIRRAHGPQFWAEPVLHSIAGRIYSRPGAGAATHHVERYRYTSFTEVNTGTHIAGHSSQGRIEMLDITDNAAPAAQPAVTPESGRVP